MFRYATFKMNGANPSKGLVAVFLLFSMPVLASAQPLEVSAFNVQNCRFIETVEGTSGYGKKPEWQSFAKSSALMQAEKLGASHVVWERFIPFGAFNGIATGKAYTCHS